MEILIILYYLINFSFFVYFYSKEKITPVTIFILSQGIFFVGFIKFFNSRTPNDLKIVLIYLLGLLFYCFGSLFDILLHPIDKRSIFFIKKEMNRKQKRLTFYIVTVSVIALVYFCIQTNFSTVNILLSNIFNNGLLEDITDSRLASYSVPGTALIYALRISIYPTVVAAILKKENGYSFFTKIFCLVTMLIFSIITGQRAGFVMIMLMFVLDSAIEMLYKKKNKSSRKEKRNIILLLFALIVLFNYLSIVNGRVKNSFLAQILKRLFTDNQNSAYYAFNYIFSVGTCWGRNYYESFVNLLVPGDKFMPLSKIIFSIMYGTFRGTAPECLWGSLFYNFSWIGVIIFGISYGMFSHYIGYRFYSREIDSIRRSVYSYIMIDLGMLVAGGPLQLFNNGFVPLVFIAYIMHIDRNVKKIKNRDIKYE